jgi:hypothetical protein
MEELSAVTFEELTMRKLLTLLATLALGLGLAQPGPGPGGGFTIDPETRKKFEAFQPVFELTRLVAILDEVDKQKGLAFTKPQAQKLLPVLKDLLTRSDLKPADAEKIQINIEDKILTPAQIKWIDTTQLAREKELRQRREQGQGQGQGQGQRPPGQGGPGGLGGPGGRGGFFQAIQQGTPFNPFKEGRGKESLDGIIAVLSKR